MIKLQNIGRKEYIFDRCKRNMENAMKSDYREKCTIENLRFDIEYSKVMFQIKYFLCKLNITKGIINGRSIRIKVVECRISYICITCISLVIY